MPSRSSKPRAKSRNPQALRCPGRWALPARAQRHAPSGACGLCRVLCSDCHRDVSSPCSLVEPASGALCDRAVTVLIEASQLFSCETRVPALREPFTRWPPHLAPDGRRHVSRGPCTRYHARGARECGRAAVGANRGPATPRDVSPPPAPAPRQAQMWLFCSIEADSDVSYDAIHRAHAPSGYDR